nr:endonuclease/exonuclease/phosphatase family protein [uncultured Marivita sp.]
MAEALAEIGADILVLTQFDFDASGATLNAFSDLIDGGFNHVLPLRSNAGIPTGYDIDGDGRLNEAEDAQAYGRFPGQESLAVLSRYPIAEDAVQSFTDLLWRELPGHHAQDDDSGREVQRLSSGGHWIVPVDVSFVDGKSRRMSLFIGHAGAPVFDGPEDRNGRRNLDELRLWELILNGHYGPIAPSPFVFMANTNLDPERGEGYRDAMAGFLARRDLTDPLPGQITANWERPGPMRVSYLLPSADLPIRAARVWPGLPYQPHRLITVDITLPDIALP